MNRKELLNRVIQIFEKTLADPTTELKYHDPYQLVVAVILSAQCTDKRVNIITKEFFKRFPTSPELANSDNKEVFEYIKSCTYPNNKTKHLLGMARMLQDEFGGKVPSDFETLQKLPGVGRKSANVIASVAFQQPTMPVDTHVFRVSQRIGLVTKSKTPLEVEKKLVAIIPTKMLTKLHHWLILHGRYVCQARKPKCSECGLSSVCIYLKNLNNYG